MDRQPRRDPRQPVTLDDLRAAGQPLHLVRRREYQRVFAGVWVHRDHVDDDTNLRAALALHGGAGWASRTSAAELLGLPVPAQAFVHVTVAEPTQRRFRRGLKSHVTQRPRTMWKVRGMRVTDPVTTFIECAGSLTLVDLVVLGDALVEKYKIKPAELLQRCRQSSDYYAGAARAAAELVRAGVDSPQETRLRLLLVFAGLPEPEVNHKVYDEHGRLLRRYDLYYPEAGVVVEYDGRQHAQDVRQWLRDIERREEPDDLDRRIIVVTNEGLTTGTARTVGRVRRALLSRGVTLPAASDRWRDHFAA